MAKILSFSARDRDFLNFRYDVAKLLAKDGHQITVLGEPTGSEGLIIAAGFKFVPLAVSRGTVSPWRLFRDVRALRSALRNAEPEVLISYSIKLSFLSALASLNLNIKRISVFTGMGFIFTDPGVYACLLRIAFVRLGRWLFRRSQVVVLNNQDLSLVKSLNFSPTVFLFPGEGINPGRFADEYCAPTGQLRITYVGRFLRDKGILDLVKVGEALLKFGVPFEIQLVGALDPENPNCLTNEEWEHTSACPFIKVLGYSENIASVWRQSHFAILLSRREGLPQSLLEAGLCKKVLVASDIPGCRQVIESDVSGILVDPGAPEQVALEIIKVFGDEVRYRKLAENVNHRIQSLFSDSVVKSCYEKIIG